MKSHAPKEYGFTLIEMAMVLVIMGLLLGGGLSVLRTQIEQQRFQATQRALEDAKEALLGFAATNGRLPCPATAASAGTEVFAVVGASNVCTNPFNGFLPAATLGITTTDGFLLDGWNTPANRIRYAVSPALANAATSTNGIRNAPMAIFAQTAPMQNHLFVCGAAATIGAPGTLGANCPAGGPPPAPIRLTNRAVAVIFSVGPNAGAGGGADEAANLGVAPAADPAFVSHEPREFNGAGGQFDDIFLWISPDILVGRMIQAGQLP